MANTTDLVFKKIVGREYTSAVNKWYEQNGTVPFKVKGADVWIEPIPYPPEEISGRIRLYTTLALVKDTGVADSKAWLVYDPDNIGVRMGNFISPRYGQNYGVNIYFDGGATPVATAHASNWFFDYEAGILTFDSNPGATTITLTAYRYIGLTADDLAKYDEGLDNLIISPGDLV